MRKIFPLLSVFVTGAIVLVVEVAATRILAPYYGNTVFTFSSVLGIVLVALSAGYHVGGKLADRRPEPGLFYALILAGGVMVALLDIAAIALIPKVGYHLSVITGPLVLSAGLFSLPCFLLGMLGPFAIKLLSVEETTAKLGSISGKVFFWSTLGSIAGSILSGLYLLPAFGVDAVLLSSALVLIVLGTGSMISFGARHSVTIAASLAGMAAVATGAWLHARPLPGHIHVMREGVYERIAVFDLTYNDRPARVLQQDRAVSGVMYLDDGGTIEYVQYFPIAALLRENLTDTLVIGGGAYIVPRLMLEQMVQVHVDVVEIEPGLIDIARTWFRLPPESPRLTNHIMDGRRFLHDTDKKYDLIFSDVFYALTIPSHFGTVEFFELAKSRLKENGVFMANFVGDLLNESPSILLTEIKTMRSAFPNSYFLATHSPGDKDVQSIVAIGVNGDKKLPMEGAMVSDHPSKYVRSMKTQLLDLASLNLQDQPVLTDDYSPTEYIALKSHMRELSDK